jgi:hemerythrin-like domain-containing protein
MKCTDLLIEDHKIILRALGVLEQMAKRVENHQVLDHDDVEIVLRFLRSFADEYHQGKEESALFPEVRRVLAPEGPVRQMLFEHDQERSLVDGIEDALFTKKGFEFVQFAHRLIDLMRDHVRKENDILFGIVERLLSPEQDEIVVAQFGNFPVDALALRELRGLETKYLSRKVA